MTAAQIEEYVQCREGVGKASAELVAAHATLRLHDVHAAIDGMVKSIYKQRGDSANAKATAVSIPTPAVSTRRSARPLLGSSRIVPLSLRFMPAPVGWHGSCAAPHTDSPRRWA